MSLAERLKAARQESGLSQRALAEKAGLSNAYVHLAEAGDDKAKEGRLENPTRSSLEKLAGALGVRIEWLAFGTGEMRDPSPSDSEATGSHPSKPRKGAA